MARDRSPARREALRIFRLLLIFQLLLLGVSFLALLGLGGTARTGLLMRALPTLLLALLFLPPLGWQTSLLYSLALAVFATLVEALSPWHIDNLTVPLLSAALLYLVT